MSGDSFVESLQSGDWLSMLLVTQFGHIWLFRVIVSLVAVGILWMVARTPGHRSLLQAILAALSIMQLVSLAWVSHAAATLGAFGAIHLLGDALHLLVAAFWPGGLVPLGAFLFLLLRSTKTETGAMAAPVVNRFSGSSLIAVTALV